MKKFINARQNLKSTTEEFTADTLRKNHACTYTDFQNFLLSLQTLSDALEVTGDEDKTTPSPQITVSIPCFKEFCNIFSISQYNYVRLISCVKFNRKNELISFRTIGTSITTKTSPSLPSVIYIGGNVFNWSNNNYYFSRENSHTLSTGAYACDYDRLQTMEELTSCTSRLQQKSCSKLVVTWVIDDTTEISRPFQHGSHFTGNLLIEIPYLVFNDVSLASKIYKWVSMNRKSSKSMESQSSSS